METKNIHTIFGRINEYLNDRRIFIDHLLINGKEIYDQFEEQIEGNIQEIHEIVVVTQTKEQLISGTIQSIIDYIDEAIPEVEALVEELYIGSSQQTWNKFSVFVEALQWIISALNGIEELIEDNDANTFLMPNTSLLGILSSILEAMENEDTILLADLIQYELMENLVELKDSLKDYIKNIDKI
ncbi:hypothetical protein [Bacillus sp. AK128]